MWNKEIIQSIEKLDNDLYESFKLIEDSHTMFSNEKNKEFTERFEKLLTNARKAYGDEMFPKAIKKLNYLKLEILI